MKRKKKRALYIPINSPAIWAEWKAFVKGEQDWNHDRVVKLTERELVILALCEYMDNRKGDK